VNAKSHNFGGFLQDGWVETGALSRDQHPVEVYEEEMMPSIDFLIIGAQKAGTTSLFEYMRRHPQIHMPPEKEVSFFTNMYERGMDWYMGAVLRGAPSDAICGEASIAYMVGTPFADVARNDLGFCPPAQVCDTPLENIVPERIRACLPNVKLICVLRDPVARAYSHYQMAVLNRVESRTFDHAIRDSLSSDALRHARIAPTSTNGYIVNGEYCRILQGFVEVFPREQLLPICSDELSDDPASALVRVFSFIDANPDVMPDNLHVKYRTAATEQRVPHLDLYAWQTAVARSRLLRDLWYRLPDQLRARIDRGYSVAGYRTTMWNAKRYARPQQMSGDTRAALVDHFLPDSQGLTQLLGVDLPWLAEWQKQ
jgi:hypothetical protein